MKTAATAWVVVAAAVVSQFLASGPTPHRVVLSVLGFAGVVALTALWGLSVSGRRSAAIGAIVVSGSFGLVPMLRTWDDPPRLARGDVRSDRLWGIALPSPDAVVRRVVPVPDVPAGATVRLRVNLADDYRGPGYLVATINGHDVGRLLKEGEAEGRSTVDACREAFFPADLIASASLATVDLRQPVPDPALRIAVFGTTRGAVAGRDAAWVGLGGDLVRGVPREVDGALVDGAPVVWLQGA